MRIHILGICGTFMAGLALIAKAKGHIVSGSDTCFYPPMSTQLEDAGITLCEGYHPGHLSPAPDIVIVGNAISRGNSALEYLLNSTIPYASGPQWLAQNVLRDQWVLAVAGTHGKTTVSAMLAWILEYVEMQPGFLIGGVPANFDASARLGNNPFFVIEADEYDTAFFDKRSKFIHYAPRTLIVNNLEYDHADIFPDLAAIQRQFHHLIRTLPSEGLILVPDDEDAIEAVLQQGCWTPLQHFSGRRAIWQLEHIAPDCQTFDVQLYQQKQGTVQWPLMGRHNMYNALAAIAAARHVGVRPGDAIDALTRFKGVKRRMEIKARVHGITIYDDFAHHPTAVQSTLTGLRALVGDQRIIAVLEPRSNSMKMGVHKEALIASLALADQAWLYLPDELAWSIPTNQDRVQICRDLAVLPEKIAAMLRPGDHVLIMSNGRFGDIHAKLGHIIRHSG